jgi:hypothetical protein
MTTSGRISGDFLRLQYILCGIEVTELSTNKQHTLSPPSSQLLRMHGHPRPLRQGLQTTPWLVLLIKS